jgi:hypothetical protein
MNLKEMIDAVNMRADDIQSNAVIIQWLNEGISVLGIAVEANFPQFSATSGDLIGQIAPIPERFHMIPVIYAIAKFKEYDSSVNEANNFMNQFEFLKNQFVATYQVEPQYRDDRLAQQFTVTDGQREFEITKNGYNPRYGDLKVYVNGQRKEDFTIKDKKFTLVTDSVAGDKITAVWEEHTDLLEPPYNFWRW